jgi:hypothetical protein
MCHAHFSNLDLAVLDLWPRAALSRPTSRSRSSMTTGPIRFGFEAKGSGGRLYLVHFVNFGPHSQKSATRQIETSAEGSHRSLTAPATLAFRTSSALRSACRAGQCLATSPSRYSLTAGRIRFEFRSKEVRNGFQFEICIRAPPTVPTGLRSREVWRSEYKVTPPNRLSQEWLNSSKREMLRPQSVLWNLSENYQADCDLCGLEILFPFTFHCAETILVAARKRRIRFSLNFAETFGLASSLDWWNKIRGSVSSFPRYRGVKVSENFAFFSISRLHISRWLTVTELKSLASTDKLVQRRPTENQSNSSQTGADRTSWRWYCVQFRTNHHTTPTLTLATLPSSVASRVMLHPVVVTGSLSKRSKKFHDSVE